MNKLPSGFVDRQLNNNLEKGTLPDNDLVAALDLIQRKFDEYSVSKEENINRDSLNLRIRQLKKVLSGDEKSRRSGLNGLSNSVGFFAKGAFGKKTKTGLLINQLHGKYKGKIAELEKQRSALKTEKDKDTEAFLESRDIFHMFADDISWMTKIRINKYIEDLEGSNSINTFDKMYEMIEGMLESDKGLVKKQKEELRAVRDQIGEGYKIEKERSPGGFRSGYDSKDVATTMHSRITGPILGLGKGQRLPIPGGTSDHAIVYEVKRGDDDKYTFSIFNTGDGCWKHMFGGGLFKGVAEFFRQLFGNRSQAYTISGLTKDSFTKDFLKKLVDISRDPNEGVGLVYKTVNNALLEGENKGHRVWHWKGQYIYRLQSEGTCAHASLEAWMRASMSEEIFKKLKMNMVAVSIDKLAKILKQLNNPQPSLSNIKAKDLTKERSARIEMVDRLSKGVLALQKTML